MTEQDLKNKLKSISDSELASICESIVNSLCKSGGKSFIMCVPPQHTDTDILLHELIDRFKSKTLVKNHLTTD